MYIYKLFNTNKNSTYLEKNIYINAVWYNEIINAEVYRWTLATISIIYNQAQQKDYYNWSGAVVQIPDCESRLYFHI